MKQPISKNLHGLIDYSYALVVPALPALTGFNDQPDAKAICSGLGIGAFAYTVLTKARWGLIRLLPFQAHLAVDVAASCFALAAPWAFGFSDNAKARNTLLAVGAAGIIATVLTNPDDEHDLGQMQPFN